MMDHLHALLDPHHMMMNRKNPSNWIFLCGGFSPFMLLGKVTLTRWVSIPKVVCLLLGSSLPWRNRPVSASAQSRLSSWPPYAKRSGASERRCKMRCFGAYRWSRVGQREPGPLEVFHGTKIHFFNRQPKLLLLVTAILDCQLFKLNNSQGNPNSPEGHVICRESWFHLMGIGKMRMARCKRTFHGQDKRSIGGHGGPLVHIWKGSNSVFLYGPWASSPIELSNRI